MVNAMQANVDRVQALKGYTRIVAPFDGIVTSRNTDVGALINAGSGTGPELFSVSAVRRLRVYVSVPQSYASIVKVGAKAKLSVPERPGKSYSATVESSSGAVNVASGSMLIQLAVDNAAGELLPGGFANVSLEQPRTVGGLSIPPSALLFDKSGLRVATVGTDDKVVLKRVTISRDLGKVIELGSGIVAGDRVIETPPDGIADGDLVRIAKADAKK
jgi:RND family efflux transporter MFP subunit